MKSKQADRFSELVDLASIKFQEWNLYRNQVDVIKVWAFAHAGKPAKPTQPAKPSRPTQPSRPSRPAQPSKPLRGV